MCAWDRDRHNHTRMASDLEIGKCLRNLNVTLGDSRDNQQRERFFPSRPEPQILQDHLSSNISCCADDVISFHYVSGEQMHLFDYLIYRVGQNMAATRFLQTVNKG